MYNITYGIISLFIIIMTYYYITIISYKVKIRKKYVYYVICILIFVLSLTSFVTVLNYSCPILNNMVRHNYK